MWIVGFVKLLSQAWWQNSRYLDILEPHVLNIHASNTSVIRPCAQTEQAVFVSQDSVSGMKAVIRGSRTFLVDWLDNYTYPHHKHCAHQRDCLHGLTRRNKYVVDVTFEDQMKQGEDSRAAHKLHRHDMNARPRSGSHLTHKDQHLYTSACNHTLIQVFFYTSMTANLSKTSNLVRFSSWHVVTTLHYFCSQNWFCLTSVSGCIKIAYTCTCLVYCQLK